MLGFAVDGQSVTTDRGPEHYRQTVVVGVGMTIGYTIERSPGGVVVTHTLESTLPGGPAGRVLSWFLARRLRKMQRGVLAALKAQVEASS